MTTTRGGAVVDVPTDTSIRITREFAAPAHLVYRPWTTPELVRRWWHANRGTMTVADIDLRVGGSWRYVLVTPNGRTVAFHGEYREIVPDQRLVSTETYEDVPEATAVNTVDFAESTGRTTLTILVEHQTREFRDKHVNSGMEDGLQDALDLLDQVASSTDG